ncbi:MAG: hypothetical protein OJF62_003605 [Pseudolabrys sp.]|nr:hypothetical protein [Pseudolabrys sp.]
MPASPRGTLCCPSLPGFTSRRNRATPGVSILEGTRAPCQAFPILLRYILLK